MKQMVTRYLVKWRGYGAEEATWERESSLRLHAQDAIDEYEYRQAQERGEEAVGVQCVHVLERKGDAPVSLSTLVVTAVDAGGSPTTERLADPTPSPGYGMVPLREERCGGSGERRRAAPTSAL